MTTDTLTSDTLTSVVPATTTPVAETATPRGNSLSLTGLILSLVSIPLGMAPIAVVGIVLGFIGYRDEPAARTTSTWAIIAGFVSLFGWVILGFGALMFALPFAFGGWMFGWF